MIVRPEEISASSAPSTSPLKHCEIKLPQLITPPSVIRLGLFLPVRRALAPHCLQSYNRQPWERRLVACPRPSVNLLRIIDAEQALARDVRCSRPDGSRTRRASASAARPARPREPPSSPPCSSWPSAPCRGR